MKKNIFLLLLVSFVIFTQSCIVEHDIDLKYAIKNATDHKITIHHIRYVYDLEDDKIKDSTEKVIIIEAQQKYDITRSHRAAPLFLCYKKDRLIVKFDDTLAVSHYYPNVKRPLQNENSWTKQNGDDGGYDEYIFSNADYQEALKLN